MILSRFFHKVELDNNIYAIFNSLMMDILYVDDKKLNEILDFNVKKEEKEKLLNVGIYVRYAQQDEDALNIVKERYNKVSGKVHIMYFVLTSACNLACKYCFIENCTFNNKVEMNMKKETALNAIRKYTEYLKREEIEDASVIFYGGEPIVNWDVIVEVIEYAKAINSSIKFSMVTNATLLSEEKIKYLAENKVEVGISIDGPKSLNDQNRIYRSSSKSVYDEVIKKFPKLKINNCKFGLSITISKDFLKQQDKVLEWLKELNVRSVFYNLYHYTHYEIGWKEYYKEASNFLIKSYEYLTNKNIYDGRLIRKIDSFFNNEFKFSDCGAIGGNQLAVKPNGDVCICHGYLKTDKYVIGNINEHSIDDLMSSDEIDFWKKRCTLNNDECLNCESIFICGGGCAIQAEALFRDRNHIDEPFCIHTKVALKWILQSCYNRMKNDTKKEVN